jgi:hypothetical protein
MRFPVNSIVDYNFKISTSKDSSFKLDICFIAYLASNLYFSGNRMAEYDWGELEMINFFNYSKQLTGDIF